MTPILVRICTTRTQALSVCMAITSSQQQRFRPRNCRETRGPRHPSGHDHTMKPATLLGGITRGPSLPLVRLALRLLGETPARAASVRPGVGAIYSIAHLSTRELLPPVRLVLEASGFDPNAILVQPTPRFPESWKRKSFRKGWKSESEIESSGRSKGGVADTVRVKLRAGGSASRYLRGHGSRRCGCVHIIRYAYGQYDSAKRYATFRSPI